MHIKINNCCKYVNDNMKVHGMERNRYTKSKESYMAATSMRAYESWNLVVRGGSHHLTPYVVPRSYNEKLKELTLKARILNFMCLLV